MTLFRKMMQKVRVHVRIYSALLWMNSMVDPQQKKYRAFVKKISQIDSIKDYKAFRDAIELAKQAHDETLPRHNKYGGEARRHYGYYQAILNYAGVKEGQLVYIPALEHGVRFRSPSWAKDEEKLISSISYACEGPGRCSEIHSVDEWKPIFVLGPYIHYASGYYDAAETQRLKQRLGRVLLVFPSHTWEQDHSRSSTNNLIEIVYQKYAADYDTVLVCTYWNDVDSPVLESFGKRGAKIVSAGFRGDPNFVRRLKTIIELSDDVIADDLQTNIGFCKYMGKQVYFESPAPRFPDDALFVENYRLFYKAFHSQDRTFTEKQRAEQDELYRFFWGGEAFIKTPEEIRDILSVLKEMCRAAHYCVPKMSAFIREQCPKHLSERRYQLLADAVAQNVWKNAGYHEKT